MEYGPIWQLGDGIAVQQVPLSLDGTAEVRPSPNILIPTGNQTVRLISGPEYAKEARISLFEDIYQAEFQDLDRELDKLHDLAEEVEAGMIDSHDEGMTGSCLGPFDSMKGKQAAKKLIMNYVVETYEVERNVIYTFDNAISPLSADKWDYLWVWRILFRLRGHLNFVETLQGELDPGRRTNAGRRASGGIRTNASYTPDDSEYGSDDEKAHMFANEDMLQMLRREIGRLHIISEDED